MKLGLSLGNLGRTVDIPLDKVQEAERLGFDSVWTAETWGHDAITPLTWIGAHTQRIRLGTSIIQIQARSPAITAMSMSTVDQLTGGRVIVGIGLSGPQVIEGWHGVPFGNAYYRVRESMQIMRKVWEREEPLTFEGHEYQLPYQGPGATGLGKPLRSILHARQLPIYVGAIGPKNLRNAAEIGDGWIATRVPPGRLGLYEPHIEEGIKRAGNGKTRDDFKVVGGVRVVLTDDVEEGFREIKQYLALYVGGMGAREKNFHNQQVRSFGYEEAAERIQDLYLAGRRSEAIDAVPDELCDEIALVGPKERIREKLQPWLDSRYDTMIMQGETSVETLRLMAELTGVDRGNTD